MNGGAALGVGLLAGLAAGWWLCARRLRPRLQGPFEELVRGITLWANGDLSASLDPEKLGAFPELGPAFEKARDAHFRMLGERRREAAKERLRLEGLIRNVPDGLVLCNLRGDVIAINPAGVEILSPRAEKGHDGTNTTEFRMKIQEILKHHTHSDVVEIPRARPGGMVMGYYRTTVKLFSSPGADDLTVMLLLRDVTTERRLEELKDEFFQSVANDLRAPLFAMQGYLRLLEKSIHPDAHQKGYFDAITQSSEKLALFIQDTLDSARMETGQLRLAATPVDPRTLVSRCVDQHRSAAEEKGARLDLALAEDLPAAIDVDERLMERVFHNLLSNALRYTPRGGAIRVAGAGAGSQVEFSVADTGPGIPEAQRARLFEKFREIETGQPRTGFGLGLNICRKIVGLHGGTIFADSEVGKGSRFIFRIPIKQRPQGEKHASTQDG